MQIKRLGDVPKSVVRMEGAEGALKQLALGRTDGVPNMSVRVFTLEPGGHTPQHAHPYEHLNYVIAGRGKLWSEDGVRDVREGDFMLVSPDERHQYGNESEEPFVFVCLVPREFE